VIVGRAGEDGTVVWSNRGCLVEEDKGERGGADGCARGVVLEKTSASAGKAPVRKLGESCGDSTRAVEGATDGVVVTELLARESECSCEGDRTIDARIWPPKLLRT
jgi:hypothetical protein